MSAGSSSIDTGSKRWLKALGITAAVSVVFMAYSFVRTLSPPEPSVEAPQKPATPADQPPIRSEPDWNGMAAGHGAGDFQSATTHPDPFAAQYAAAAKAAAINDPVARQKDVHRQAQYLRDLISQGKPTDGFGNLTKEQVDEMEQKGITIQ